MGNNNSNSVNKLFENNSIFVSTLKVTFFGVILSLASAIYVFVDQIFMTHFIPMNSHYSEKILFGEEYNKLLDAFSNNILDLKINTDISSLVKISISLSAPLVTFCSAIALMLALGVSINYSKHLGKKEYDKLNQTFNNGFYLSLIISISTSLIMLIISYFIIKMQLNTSSFDNHSGYTEDQKIAIDNFLLKYNNIAIKWAFEYSSVLIAFNFLNTIVILLVNLLGSQAKNLMPTIFMLIANVINITLDYVLLRYSNTRMIGSSIATVISWVISLIIIICYIQFLNKKNDCYLKFNQLKGKLQFDKTIVLLIIFVGISSFLRNISNAVFATTQQSILGNNTFIISQLENSYYLSILGVVNPIYNLFYAAIIGIIRGGRIIVAYNYGKGKMDKVAESYWYTILISTCYSIFFFIFIAIGIPNQFLKMFNVSSSDNNYQDVLLVLFLTLAQLPFLGLTISGMLYFQSTQKIVLSYISSIMNGIIIGVPGMFIANEIAKANSNINYLIYAPLVLMVISSLFIFSFSSYYVLFKNKKNNKII